MIFPGVTNVRIRYPNAFDQFYIINKDFQLESVELPTHSGRPGTHDTIEMLIELDDDVGWEIYLLDLRKLRE